MAAARVSFTELGKLFAATPLPLYAVDAERIVRYANPALLTLLELTGEELIGKPTAFTSGGATRAERAMAALCPDPRALSGAAYSGTTIVESAGQHFSCQVDWLPLPQIGEQGAAVLGIVRLPTDSHAARGGIDDADFSFWDAPINGAEPPDWHARLAQYRAETRRQYRLEQLVGESSAIRVAQGQAKLAAVTHVPVCLVGPTGGGRYTLALAIHYAAESPDAVVTLECRLLTTELLAARLQGLGSLVAGGTRGAAASMTKATHESEPHAKADPPQHVGTLILRGLDDLPAGLASRIALLCRPESSWRVLTTANRPLAELINTGMINADLAARLAVLTIQLPPLAERREDLPWLIQAIVEQQNARGGKQLRGCTPAALERLAAHDWPGETAELAGTLRAARDQARGTEIAAADLPGYLTLAEERHRRAATAPQPIDLPAWLAESERELLRRALAHARGNKTAAAKLVGMNRPRFYRRLIELGLEADAAAETAEDGGIAAATTSPQSSAPHDDREAKRATRRAERIAMRRKTPPPLPPQPDSLEPEFVEDIPFIPEGEDDER